MIDIHLDPNLVLFGPFTLSWHGIFSVVGIVAGVWLSVRLARARVSLDDAYSVATWGVVGGILGARLFHVVDQWDLYASQPLRILAMWDGGIAIVGAVVGGILGGFVRGLRLKLPIGFGADAAAPGLAIGLGIGRIGDIINGEHHATGCEALPWCVRYTHPNTLGQGPLHPPPPGFDYVHPAVAYEMLVDFAIVGLVLWLRRFVVGSAGEGRLLWLFLALYGSARFFISFLRFDAIVFAGLRQAQLVSLLFVAVAAVMLVWLTVRRAQGQGPLRA